MLDINALRSQFPALHIPRDGRTPIFLDGPAGTQVPQRVLDAMVNYLTRCNANHGGVFASSVESDRILDAAHVAMADLLNAPSPDEIIFGQNMTSLTLHLSRSIARMLKPEDEIMVSRLDHDANITPWVLAARDAGATVRWIDLNPGDASLSIESFRRQLSKRTKLVAVGLAANSLGTINPAATMTREAKAAGAWVFLDAVHYAPHGPIDVQELGCDFLACSAYKFFGPHVGVLWGRRELLEALPAYKIRPAPDALPGKWMTGTQNHEGLAGVAAAIDYLATVILPSPSWGEGLGVRGGPPTNPSSDAEPGVGGGPPTNPLSDPGPGVKGGPTRRQILRQTMTAIQEFERTLSRRLLSGLAARPRFTVWGVRDLHQLARRVPTIAVTDAKLSPRQFAEFLAERQIYTWNGNMYALEMSECLGLEPRGGFVRLGMVHYNTPEEIDRVLAALDELP